MKIAFKYNRIYKESWWFWFAYGLYLCFSLMCRSMYAQYIQSLSIIVYVIVWLLLLLGECINHKTTRKGLIIAILCPLLFLITFRNSSYVYATTFILIYCARTVDFMDIAKFTVKVSTICLLFVLFSAYFGIIRNYVFTGYRDKGVYKDRSCMGFLYALYSSTIFFNITALEIYIKKINIKWREIAFLLMGNYYFYYETDSRLCFITAIVLIVYIVMIKVCSKSVKKQKSSKLYACLCLSYLISFGISWWLTVGYMSGIRIISKLSESMSGRLRMNVTAIIRYGISLFGTRISFSGSGLNIFGERVQSEYFYVDNLYIQSLLVYGVIFIAILVVLYTVASIIAYKSKDYILLVILSMLAVHGIIDDLILYLYFNTFMFLLVMIIAEKSNQIYEYRCLKRKFK